jgi:hypothetical protein
VCAQILNRISLKPLLILIANNITTILQQDNALLLQTVSVLKILIVMIKMVALSILVIQQLLNASLLLVIVTQNYQMANALRKLLSLEVVELDLLVIKETCNLFILLLILADFLTLQVELIELVINLLVLMAKEALILVNL